MDCASDSFFEMFKSVSRQNSKIYEDVFKCLPSNQAKTFKSMNDFVNSPKLANTDPNKAKQFLDEHVSGFIVDFPLEFLENEDSFFPSVISKEGIVPNIVWT
jgi:phospholipase D1/2